MCCRPHHQQALSSDARRSSRDIGDILRDQKGDVITILLINGPPLGPSRASLPVNTSTTGVRVVHAWAAVNGSSTLVRLRSIQSTNYTLTRARLAAEYSDRKSVV